MLMEWGVHWKAASSALLVRVTIFPRKQSLRTMTRSLPFSVHDAAPNLCVARSLDQPDKEDNIYEVGCILVFKCEVLYTASTVLCGRLPF